MGTVLRAMPLPQYWQHRDMSRIRPHMGAIPNVAAARLRLATRSTLARPGVRSGNEIPNTRTFSACREIHESAGATGIDIPCLRRALLHQPDFCGPDPDREATRSGRAAHRVPDLERHVRSTLNATCPGRKCARKASAERMGTVLEVRIWRKMSSVSIIEPIRLIFAQKCAILVACSSLGGPKI